MSGWKNMNCRHNLVFLMMISLSPVTHSEPEIHGEAPALELLEFLGEWETDEGEWIDPAELEDDDFASLLNITHDEANSPGGQRSGGNE